MGINVIGKGKFDLPLNYNFINLTHYLFTKEEEHNFLLLKLTNDRDEAVTKVTLEITQKDARGLSLGAFTVSCPVVSGKPHSPFVLDSKILLASDCADFSVKILSADFGNYRYTLSGSELVLSYVKKSSDDSVNFSYKPFSKSSGAASVSAKNVKISILLCFFILVVTALSIVFSYLHLQSIITNTQTFFNNGIKYSFVNDKSPEGDIIVVGCEETLQNVVIPEKVYGHNVVGIDEKAFYYNNVIRSLTIKAPITIKQTTFYECDNLTNVILEKVTRVENSAFGKCENLIQLEAFNLSEIGAYAFRNCYSLKTIKISNKNNSVLKIGSNAFSNCSTLTDVTIDQLIDYSDGVDIFKNSYNIKKLSLKNYNYNFQANDKVYFDSANHTISELMGLPYDTEFNIYLQELYIENMDVIPSVFCYGIQLESIKIKKLVQTTVGSSAFFNCNVLSTIDFPVAFSQIGDSAFMNTAIKKFDGSKLVSIGKNAFAFCYSLSEIDFKNNKVLTTIKDSAFQKCISLKSIVLPESVTEVEQFAFSSCSSLTELVLNNNLLKIGNFAFSSNSKLTSVSVPKGVETIGLGAFYECNELKEISLPFIGGALSENNFFGYIFGMENPKDYFAVPKSIVKVTVENVEKIPENAFFNWGSIKEINFKSDFTSIGRNAFYECKNLKSFVIPASVKQVDEDAFKNCYKMYEIYNLSGLNIKSLSLEFGSVGFYALKIYKSLNDAKMNKTVASGFEFGESDLGVWYLLNYTGTATSLNLPQNIYFNGKLIESYEIIHHMAVDNESIKEIIFTERVSAVGDFAFENCKSLRKVLMSYNLNSIGHGALKGCDKIEELSVPFIGRSLSDNRFLNYIFGAQSYDEIEFIPSGLKTLSITKDKIVPDYAFYGFKSLENVALPNSCQKIGDYAFNECLELKNINLPLSLITIGEKAFYYCGKIETVVVPNSVTSIGFGAFSNCEKMNKLTIPFVGGSINENQHLGYIFGYKNYYNSSIPYTLNTIVITKGESIPENAFYNLPSLQNITFPYELKTIGENAFYYCYNLKEVSFWPSLKNIQANAFNNCSALKKVTLLSNVVVDSDAFYNCLSLLEVYNLGGMDLVEGSKEHGYLAFYALAVYTSASDEPIKEVEIDGLVFMSFKDKWQLTKYTGSEKELKLSSFEYQGKVINSYSIKMGSFSYISSPSKITIGKEVTYIEEKAFQGCYSLNTVIFEESAITEINSFTFNNCENLINIVLPKNLKKIKSYAFSGCSKLYTIEIPQSVLEIEIYAFRSCYALCDVYNYSALNFVKGSYNNGEVARYALRISSSPAIKKLEIAEEANFRFMLFDFKWYLISEVKPIYSNYLSLPKSFSYKGTVINSYIFREYVLSGKSYDIFYISKAVEKIQADPDKTLYYSVSKILYEGTLNEWEALLLKAPGMLLEEFTVKFNSEMPNWN